MLYGEAMQMSGGEQVRIYAFEMDWTAARRLGEALGAPVSALRHHHFPDGESMVTASGPIGGHCVIYATLRDPDARVMPLLLGIDALRQGGAARVELVAPYMPYMRQDRVFAPGQPLSAQVWGRLLGQALDRVFTVDPHLHRIGALDEALGAPRGVVISAAPAMRAFALRRLRGAVLVGPDEESRAMVEEVAQGGFDYQIAHKERRGDLDVRIALSAPRALENRRALILDDIASSGRTLAQCVRAVRAAGALGVDCMVTHALFAGNALEVLEEAGVGSVWSSDTLPHATNRVPLAEVIAQRLRDAWATPAEGQSAG